MKPSLLKCLTFHGWWRNETHETNDNFIHDYQSIYTIKEMPIQAARKQMLNNMDDQQMLISTDSIV